MDSTLIVALIGAFTTVLGIWISHYLTKSYHEQKRKDDLADREFNRRAVAYDKRVREAGNFIDRMEAQINRFEKFTLGTLYFLLDEKHKKQNLEAFIKDMNSTLESFPVEKNELVSVSSLKLLDDKELMDLYSEFKDIMLCDGLKFWDILGKLKLEGKSDESIFEDIDVLNKALNKVKDIIIKMKVRLDELAVQVT